MSAIRAAGAVIIIAAGLGCGLPTAHAEEDDPCIAAPRYFDREVSVCARQGLAGGRALVVVPTSQIGINGELGITAFRAGLKGRATPIGIFTSSEEHIAQAIWVPLSDTLEERGQILLQYAVCDDEEEICVPRDLELSVEGGRIVSGRVF